MSRGCIHIGTSGWHYPHWIGPFYPEHMPSEEFLSYYAQHFRTVEINNTFYHLPSPQTLANWCHETPNDFVFACKASRFITHMKKLKDPEQSITRFFENIQVLNKKLGPILFQLPPRWRINENRLEDFLKTLPKTYRFAFEFRDESWFTQPIYELLAKHNAAFCLYNLAGMWSPQIVTANFVYIRLHGPDGPYKGQYSGAMLQSWAKKCLHWANTGKNVYCFFDNDEQAHAITNSLSLKKQITMHQRTSNLTPLEKR